MLWLLCDVTHNHIWRAIKREIWFPHPIGITIAKGAVIGNGCVIYQNVTIGNNELIKHVTLKENVKVYGHSMIIGKLTIGENTVVGACTFINKDVPANSVVITNKELKYLRS